MKVLSLQSAVAYGHVGNSAAVFPLQRLGFEVWPVDTVQFSNHPGYGAWGGDVLPPDHVARVVAGLDAAGVLSSCDAVLSGYLGDSGTGEAVLAAVAAVKAANPNAIYLCDPVIGDGEKGVYVQDGIPAFFAERAIAVADVITPNRFELELLSGQPAPTLSAAAAAAGLLIKPHPSRPRRLATVVVTGLEANGGMASLAVTAEGAWAVRTPLLPFNPPLHGAGDALAALLLAHLLRGEAAPEALSLAVSSLWGVLDKTLTLGQRELALVAAQDEIALPSRLFPPLPVA